MMASAFKKGHQKNTRKCQTVINCPAVKRPENRPVALQGWLMKRGSDGLMLWRRRWFVLSDYCLFYYKDTQEEKLLGSLILASYEISPCNSDERGYKKFSFKAEHANMRTYYFAAENQEIMEQWIKAMTLASLLEENMCCESNREQSRAFPQADRNSGDYLSMKPVDPTTPNSRKSPELQPLYANAPPKPKRLNDSSSPECQSDLSFRDDYVQHYQNQPYHTTHSNCTYQYSNSPSRQLHSVNNEQRVPDPNGSTITSQSNLQVVNQNGVQLRTTKHMNISKDSQSSKNVSFNFPPRPHSVDFLEYNTKSSSNLVDSEGVDRRNLNCRPKSSLSTVNTSEAEAVHWSAEEYARKMRQSSLYLKTTRYDPTHITKNSSHILNAEGQQISARTDMTPIATYRAERLPVGDDKLFYRSASARLFRETNDCKDDFETINNPINNQAAKLKSQHNLHAKDPATKAQQREESMKRLLEWKERMLESPQNRKLDDAFRKSNYSVQSKRDTCESTNSSSIGNRLGNTPDSMVKQKCVPLEHIRPLVNEISHENIGNNCSKSAPAKQFYCSPGQRGLEGREPKYGNPVSIVQKNSPNRDGRKNHADCDNKILNEISILAQKADSPDTRRSRISDSGDYSDDNSYAYLRPDYTLAKNIELPLNGNSNYDIQNIKNQVHGKSHNLQDIRKKHDLKLSQHQTIDTDRDEEWGTKIDESRVIKEFSYQYITSEEYNERQQNHERGYFMHSNSKNATESSNNAIGNQSKMINSFDNNAIESKDSIHNKYTKNIKKDNVSMKNSCRNQQKFKGALTNKANTLGSYRNNNVKSYSEGISKNDNIEKRLVQSDSEALLYDTSSDIEESPGFPHDRLAKLNLSSDDERDEEVAAVLSKEKLFSPPIFPSLKSPYQNCSSSENIEHSLIVNSISSMDMSLKVNEDKKPAYQMSHEKNLSISSDVNSDNQEENYMPMTPRKKTSGVSKHDVIHSRSNSACHSLLLENLMASSEESPYVEMTQNHQEISSSLIDNSYKHSSPNIQNDSTYENSMNMDSYCEIGKGKDIEYEAIYNAPIPQEPLYMEVPSLLETDNKTLTKMTNDNELALTFNKVNNLKDSINQISNTARPLLPDILNTTTSLNQVSGRSDSSDADDEASKDLDSLDTPRHPRFSLSDTFRPASYYLGASLNDRAIITINTEHPDSSDSDLVSPPPIPTSSPPLDELETSIDSTTVNKESVLPKFKPEISNVYTNDDFINSNNNNNTVSSYKIKNFIRTLNSNLYEASSEESINFEKREQRLKRRPLSADILSSLQDINFIMPPTDLQLKGPPLPQKIKSSSFQEDTDGKEADQIKNTKTPKSKVKKINDSFVSEKKSKDDTLENDYDNQLKYDNNRFSQETIFSSSNILNSMNVEPNDAAKNQYENIISNRQLTENNEGKIYYAKYNNNFAAEHYSHKSSAITDSKTSIDSNSSTEHQNNAPYYYSDLLKVDAKSFQEFEKNRWEERISDNNSKILTLTEKNMLKPIKYSPVNESDSIKFQRVVTNHSPRNSDSQEGFTSAVKTNLINQSPTFLESKERNTNLSQIEKVYSIYTSSTVLKLPHRTRSLEGLIDSQQVVSLNTNSGLAEKSSTSINETLSSANSQKENVIPTNKPMIKKMNDAENEDLWEEDTLWRESLRKVSKRHTRSLEDLDRKENSYAMQSPTPKLPEDTHQTYENICIAYNNEKSFDRYANENPLHNYETGLPFKPDMKYYSDKKIHENTKNENKIVMNQKITEPQKTKMSTSGTNSSFEIDREKLRQWDLLSSAPAMLSSNRAIIKPINERQTFPTTNSTGIDSSKEAIPVLHKESDKNEKLPPTSVDTPITVPHDSDQGQTWSLKVSAGELLGRTHEELVLLLIQLRRQRATICQSMDKCHREIEAKACLADLDKVNRLEYLQKLEELKAKLSDLEKQYEKGKPLVNLVDNMVKLGSLYHAGSPQKLEFIQRIQEERLLAEERRDWDRVRPDQQELRAKVERLYRLDKLLQEESGTLHSLQQDKGVLERAIGGLRNKLQGIHGNSPETEWYKRQQRILEKELSRVRSILALNSKKLEETVAENARLEQELVVLRQKLQLSRRTAEPGGANTAALEAELCRVQLLVGNLLRQRQELSLQVRQLTEKSNSLSRQIWPNSPDYQGDVFSSSSGGSTKKQLNSGWIETDLDADVTSETVNLSSPSCNTRQHSNYVSPLYVNTADRESMSECCMYQDDLFDGSPLMARSPDYRFPDNHDEEVFKQAYGLPLKEKPQEIKTVRIVKRESERRQRDRDRSGNIGIPITYTNPKRSISEDRLSDKSMSEKDVDDVLVLDNKANEPPPTPGPRTDSVNVVWNMVRRNKIKGKLLCKSSLDRSEPLGAECDSPQLSPVYLSETARRIVEEVAWQGMGEKRLVPKEKRRHHTMSGPLLMAPQHLFSQRGSRDDLDIERVLRPRLTTPDVVRSTLIRVDPHYTKETIDNILGAPGKILIPERYIPESQPELTKEELSKRSKKADAIRKMLCETTALAPKDNDASSSEKATSLKKKVAEEKKNREHLLQLSQILAQQVMEKSKIVAGVNPTPME